MNKYKSYKSIFDKKIKVVEQESEEEKAKESIKWLIDNDWGVDNDSQGKASQLFKALSFNNSSVSNKFMDEVNKYTSTLKDKYQ